MNTNLRIIRVCKENEPPRKRILSKYENLTIFINSNLRNIHVCKEMSNLGKTF